MRQRDHPSAAKTNAHLGPGSSGRSDGRRPVRVRARASGRHGRPSGGRTRFIAAILDWVGGSPPSSEAIAGSPVLSVGNAHVRLISFDGGAILGERPLAADGIEPPATVDTYWGDGYAVARAERRFIAGDRRRPPTSARCRVPADRRDASSVLTGRGVVQFDHRLTDDDFRRLGEWFRATRRWTSALRFLRPLDHGPRVPSLLSDAAPVRRRRAVGLADVARRPAPPAARSGGARDRRDQAKLDLAVLSRFRGAALALPRGSDEAPRGHLGPYALDDLTLRSITMPDLSLLLPMKGLARWISSSAERAISACCRASASSGTWSSG